MTTTTSAVPPQIARLQHLHPEAVWRHEPELPLEAIDLIASVTNQVRAQPLNLPTVERYVDALEAGDVFPPIVVRELTGPDGHQLVNLGGNHRTRAHIDAGRKTIDAWVVTIEDDVAALELAFHDNAAHGLPTSEEERITHALVLMDHGRSTSLAARTVGIAPSRLYGHLERRKVAKRAADLGLTSQLSKIGVSVQARLGSVKDDRILAKVIRTIADEGMGQLASQQLVTDTNAARDVASAMDAIALHVRDWRDRPGDRRGAKAVSSAHTTLTVNLKITRALDPADVIAGARSPAERERLAQLCMEGARHLKTIHDLVKAADQ